MKRLILLSILGVLLVGCTFIGNLDGGYSSTIKANKVNTLGNTNDVYTLAK